LSPIPDWKGNTLADPSGQTWFEKMPFSLGPTCSIDQAEERKSVIFEALLLLMALMEQKSSGFQRIITGNES
jgi:hypothetical protein